MREAAVGRNAEGQVCRGGGIQPLGRRWGQAMSMVQ